MVSRPTFHAQSASPESIVEQRLAEFSCSQERVMGFMVRYSFSQYWLEGAPELDLQAYYELSRELKAGGGITLIFSVTTVSGELQDSFELADSLELFCKRHSLPVFNAESPAQLETVAIAKPWGQEVWYTGIESRGVARLQGLNGIAEALPIVLSALPSALAGGYSQALILLKILDPLPQEVLGDLYFELHEKKREVYVVTAVDEKAWPGGVGAIRFGFDRDKVASYKSEQEFKEAYIQSVKAYEATRRKIDDLLDGAEEVDAQLKELEYEQRQFMNGFTHLMPLQVGDVVKVPCLTPHSLQHGVRTVEFQTPVYERLIVSFAQKVLTQDCWDTDRAASIMSMSPADNEGVEVLANNGAVIERVVDFEDFEVKRFTLPAGRSVDLQGQGEYCLIMAVVGVLNFDSVRLKPEQAAFAPKKWQGALVENCSSEPVCFLAAYPK